MTTTTRATTLLLHTCKNRLFTWPTCCWRRTQSTARDCRTIHSEFPPSASPLEGVRILDLTRIVAGPYCTMLLADLGAEVIKIERPGGGDEARKWGPPWAGQGDDIESCYFLPVNRNKYSVCVDIKSEKGKEIIRDLAKASDVLVENYVPGKLDQMGLGYNDLKEIAPHLIYCSITGYGNEGPYRNKPGYDVIAASRGGLLHVTGPQDGGPVKVGVAMTDIATGLYAHGAIMAALFHRNRNSAGQKIDVNLLSTQLACLINMGSSFLNGHQEGKRWGTAHESIVPYQAFETKDGYYTLGTGSDAQFVDYCRLINRPELSEMEEFKTNKDRVINRQKLIEILNQVMRTRTNSEWEDIFSKAAFPNGPVNSLREAFNDKHVQEIGLVQEINHSKAGTIKLVGPAVKYSKARNAIRAPPPSLGEHTDAILQKVLQYNEEKLKNLHENHVIS